MVVVPRLVAAMEIVRGLVQRPVHVNSWCRCPQHNAKEGGAPDSQHLRGLAVDWWCDDMTPEEMYKVAREISIFRYGGIGVYGWGVHTDGRSTGTRRWGPLWHPGLDG
jgi:zinc D-Ala-D-Ala carboxypeptidase